MVINVYRIKTLAFSIIILLAYSCSDGGDSSISDGGGLPPDPGEAGKLTLEGMDSDNDGLRDDIQRYVALEYHDSQKTQAATHQHALEVQKALIDASSKPLSLEHDRKVSDSIDCMFYIRPDDAHIVIKKLLVELVNTSERLDAYLTYDKQLSGETFTATPLSSLKSSCGFDPDLLGG